MKISLNGKWQVRDSKGEFEFLGSVPGTVQGDLVTLGLMPHPYKGVNEELFLKLEERDWEYFLEFELDNISGNLIYELVFEGIDTLSYVYLNGEFLGKTEDMFLEYRFDVKNILKQGRNKLRVHILSPMREPAVLMKNYGKLAASHEYDVRPYIRKAQYSYGWDWGARIVTSGIWKDVFIEAREDARIFGSFAYLTDIDGTVKVAGYVSDLKDDISAYQVKVLVDGETVGIFPLDTDHKGILFEGEFKRPGIALWYPRNMGKPVLHDFEFILIRKDREVYKEKKKIGLRTVRIVQEKDEIGESFVFYINERPVFAKGANWIPADNILSWLSPEDYRKLVEMAYDANMNMLRVWGGGIYEDETFYNTCDELGIMVWQDFMFACAEYPDHIAWFRELANREVRENIVKLRHHPSIVLWCGNNENNWGFDEWVDFVHKVDGKFLGNILYLEDFPKLCADEDPSRPYWPSSPYGGKKPNSEESGDRHNWDVWSGWQDYTKYTKDHGRFLSEFGFQGAPDPKTIEFFASEKEQELFHKVMVSHNKQVEGPERIMKFIHNHFGLIKNFDVIVYLSQLNQAEAIKEGVEHWRSRKYKTSGTLYWQFNDSWPVFSWSAIDYFKRPKALYWYTKRFYSDVLPIVFRKGNVLSLKIINDRTFSLKGALFLEIYNISTGRLLLEKKYEDIQIGPDMVEEIDRISVGDLDKAIVFVRFDVGDRVYKNHKLFANLRDIPVIDPEIKMESRKEEFILTTRFPAYGVWIEGEGVEDNFFSISPKYPVRIKASEIRKILSVYDFLRNR